MQFSYFDERKDTTKNYSTAEFLERLEETLSLPFCRAHVQSTSGDTHIRITKKGKALITRGKPSRRETQPDLSHNRAKQYPLIAGSPDAFLEAVGIMERTGRVRAAMQGKFHQVNEFLRLTEQVLPRDSAGSALDIVDCGCGNAYLTFAAFHYLNHVRGIPTRVVGVDSNREIIESRCQLRDSLRWEGLEFAVSRIADFSPSKPPDIVLSLHACDTATDEAIAQGIAWGSRVILAAPCCQHEMHTQLKAAIFRPVLRHGILKERMADLLTDAFRALILRIMGYRTDVVQFVSPEHTSKNLLIRARKALKPGERRFIREYEELKKFWEVEPMLEIMIAGMLRGFRGDSIAESEERGITS
jgi:SAM-dependent methyltransferase